jgi:hypothetical protein
VVFVDEPAESVAALYIAGNRWRRVIGRIGWDKRESSMRAYCSKL